MDDYNELLEEVGRRSNAVATSKKKLIEVQHILIPFQTVGIDVHKEEDENLPLLKRVYM